MMKTNRERKNFLSSPSKKTVMVLVGVWAVGLALLVMAMTDLFTQSLFQGKYLMCWFLMAASAFSVFRVLRTYRLGTKPEAN